MAKRVVHKYPLKVVTTQTIVIPQDAKPVHIGLQNGEIMAWVDHPADGDRFTEWKLACFGTGEEYDPSNYGRHRGTVQIDPFVWHFFDDHTGEVSQAKTLRDEMAMAAMNGMIEKSLVMWADQAVPDKLVELKTFPKLAYQVADAMMEERKKHMTRPDDGEQRPI